MTSSQSQKQSEIGMVGLGVMGRNLLLNMADHDFSVTGYDKDPAKVASLRQEAKHLDARGAADIREFVALLRRPRAIMMLVPAGAPVDSVIKDLIPHLDKGDLIIDAGNSYFKDTNVRSIDLAEARAVPVRPLPGQEYAGQLFGYRGGSRRIERRKVAPAPPRRCQEVFPAGEGEERQLG
jgi:prephenate dehydrogenase